MDSNMIMMACTVFLTMAVATYASCGFGLEHKKVEMLRKEIAERENAMKQAYARLGALLDQQRYMMKTLNHIESEMFYIRSINKAKEGRDDAERGNE